MMITSVKNDDGHLLDEKNNSDKDVGIFEKKINNAKLDGRKDNYEESGGL